MVEADVVDLVRRVRTRVEGRGDYPREITQGRLPKGYPRRLGSDQIDQSRARR